MGLFEQRTHGGFAAGPDERRRPAVKSNPWIDLNRERREPRATG
jgi:hypothetical protein